MNILKEERLAQGSNEPSAQKLNLIVSNDVALDHGELVTAQAVRNVIPEYWESDGRIRSVVVY